MSLASLKEFLNKNGIISAIMVIFGLYALSIFYKYFSSKSSYNASEGADQMPSEYKNSDPHNPNTIQQNVGIQAADEKPNEYSLINETQQAHPQGSQPSAELLPKDDNSQWSQLHPVGAGELQGINLLSAGYHIGIDTIGQTLRNANLQIRSEPPNPQINVGPWNQTTISPDLMRTPLELGAGGQ
jgi:hypothetical protein